MHIHLTPEQSSQFSQLAAAEGRAVEELANEALSRYLSEEARFAEAVAAGKAQLARGEWLSHEDVGERLATWLRS